MRYNHTLCCLVTYLCANDALRCLVLEPLEEVAVFRRLVVKRRLVRQAHLLRHHLPRHVNIHAYVTISQYTPARKVQYRVLVSSVGLYV